MRPETRDLLRKAATQTKSPSMSDYIEAAVLRQIKKDNVD
jgi:hypothetical protein